MVRKSYEMSDAQVAQIEKQEKEEIEQAAKTPRDKAGNFKRLAEARTNKALKSIELIGNLSNRASYTYTDDQIQKIFDALENQLYAVKAMFNNTSDTEKEKFTL